MDITLVKDRENDVHDEHGQRHQDGQTRYRVTECLRFALQLTPNSRRHDFSGCLTDEVSRVAQGYAWLQIEKQRHTRELIQVVYSFWTERLFPGYQFAERHKPLSVVRSNVKLRKILWFPSRFVLNFEDDLILILGLFDQIQIILRVRGAQQLKNARL